MRVKLNSSSARGCGLVLTCSFFLTILAPAQIPAPSAPESKDQSGSLSKATEEPSKAIPTIRAQSRLVVVDVVVTGRHRRPELGLTKSDFTLLEDGKPQPVMFFEAHVPPVATAEPAQNPVSSHEYQYSNASSQTPSSINIVLFDVLNTPLMDQAYAREQMIQFLKTLPSGQQVSLFELGTRLHMIAGFTTTSDVLVAAARKVVPHSSELLDTQEEREQGQDQLELMREGSMNQEFFDRMQDFMNEAAAGRDENRASITLQALAELDRAVSGFRGRKNVIWLSEEFPVYFGPDLNSGDLHLNPGLRSYSEIMRDTAAGLSSSQISIYPVDVRGLIYGGLASASKSGRPPVTGQIMNIEKLHMEMDELAKQTGGHAYYNTNDLRLAMQQSLQNGSHYYTLAYVPRNTHWDSKYHRIKVQLARPGLEAEYRKGYYAVPEKQRSEDEVVADLINATQPATPQSTMLLLKAQVRPPDHEHAKVRIDCVLDGAGLAFTDGPGDRKSARLRFITVAWDSKLKTVANVSHTVDLSLSAEKYEEAVHNGIASHQELHLAPGAYRIRLGVMDDGSQKIGTLDIPLQIDDDIGKIPAQ